MVYDFKRTYTQKVSVSVRRRENIITKSKD